jgi:23S rRNA (cytosine1962-C5)-methyltransferase
VRVVDHKGKLLGTAHYSSTSQITLRLLSRRAEIIDTAFLQTVIEKAYQFRQRVVRDSNAYRLVHAEGDLLPGLIVDRYGDWMAVQLLDQGMDRLAAEITTVLQQLLHPKGIIARNDVPVMMNGLVLQADLLGGQKTGVFLDQRENYLAVRRFARGRALDCFTGSGGFALHLASVCDSVEAVDSASSALAVGRINAVENRLTNIEFREANILDYLPNLAAGRQRFDVVIVDPPAFTKSRSAVEGAARGYKEINLRALRLLNKGGVLVSCSCSHHMSEAHLFEVIAAAALDAGKQLRVLERRTQSQDHSILLTVPETHYLKCLILEVL